MQTMSSAVKSPQTSEADKTRLAIQDWLHIPVMQTSAVIGKNEDGSDITQDVDVLRPVIRSSLVGEPLHRLETVLVRPEKDR